MAVSYLLLFSINILLLTPTMSLATQPPQSKPTCLLFNFGDSNSDMGGACAAFGIIPPMVPNRLADCRASNGRLYLDFLCESLGSDPLRPYMDSFGLNFINGANFAIMGMTAQPMNNHCFPLTIQVNQYAYFLHRVRQVMSKGLYDFRNAIFTIDIGQNDLSLSLGLSHQQIVGEKIPVALQNIENAIKTLHGLGAHKFVIHNTGPLGCLPRIIENEKETHRYFRLDRAGCLAEVNEFAKLFNDGLRLLSTNLRSEMKEAIIVYIDMFTIKYSLIVNASNYGFENPLVPCLSHHTICLDPSRAVSWDGLHYTDAVNEIVASMVGSGDYAAPHMKLQDLCALVIEE